MTLMEQLFYSSRMEPLLKILAMFENNKSALARSVAELSKNEKFSPTHINNWFERDKRVSHDYVLCLSELSKWEVTPHELRPDLYPHEDDGLPEHLRKKVA